MFPVHSQTVLPHIYGSGIMDLTALAVDNQNHRRCKMNVSKAVDFHLQYHQANSKKNTIKTCGFVLSRFTRQFGKRDLASIAQEEVLEFLVSLTKNNRQATKRNRYSVLSSFYNFSISTAQPALTNPCNSSVIRKIFKRPQSIQWQIIEIFKEMEAWLKMSGYDPNRVYPLSGELPKDIE